MLTLVNRLFDEMETIDQNEVEGLEQFLQKYVCIEHIRHISNLSIYKCTYAFSRYRNVLHKNHYLNLSAKHSLCQVYGRSEKHMLHLMTDTELKRKEEYCRDLLNVVDFLEPGLSRLRGVVMYELHAPIMMQTNRLFELKRITNAELKKRLKEVIMLLRESETILSFEPEGTSEAEMATAAKDALTRMVGFA